MPHRNRNDDKSVLVIGLGRFGSSLALELVNRGWDVLGVDTSPRLVQTYADALTHTVIADATDEEALRQIGASNFNRAVVAIGTHLEESILATSQLVDLGVSTIWAKATSRRHGRILEQVGAHHVVLPEHDMGERVAHLLSGQMLDYVELEEGFSLGKTKAPKELLGKSLRETGVRQEYGITVVSVKRMGAEFTYATQETVLNKGDVIVVAGRTDDVERFSEIV
ncbi:MULTISPECIES: potassium channel family protein [Nocardiopsidaceae]|uniref:TrkA family potassium uptake protein n=2 Tax=Nocardiopsidaceae TaxID=83676 RepID=A0ABY6YJG0_9ACTN|nr:MULTISPECIES: TrkA family potassium uptake protein [Nocardiopsaceae]MEE2042945.1 TrkA family potassium uptake protein [Nocardiopsis tropica]MEE2053560.1 TrkA family potassium uptake protein [Nocardiopsis umidischolae]WAE72362.1 TrkA family potassium uptake protein [Streptomonospora nanhaiensis]